MADTQTERDLAFVEEWESVCDGQVYVIKMDHRGDTKFEAVSPGRRFTITTSERLINQEKVSEEHLDPFANGWFKPVTVPDDVTDTNPNALATEDIERVFGASSVAWDEYLELIDSSATLRRMIDVAADMEDVSHARVRQVEQKLAELNPKKRILQRDQDRYEKMGPVPQGTGTSVTPR